MRTTLLAAAAIGAAFAAGFVLGRAGRPEPVPVLGSETVTVTAIPPVGPGSAVVEGPGPAMPEPPRSHPGTAVRPSAPVTAPAMPPATPVLPPGVGQLIVRVLHADGRAAEGVAVSVYRQARPQPGIAVPHDASGETDARGEWGSPSLAPGAVYVTATVRRRPAQLSAGATVRDGLVSVVVLEIPAARLRAPAITGTVRDGLGNRLAAVAVTAHWDEGGEPVTALTDGRGEYALPMLPLPPADATRIEVEFTRDDHEGTNTSFEPEAEVSNRVVDAVMPRLRWIRGRVEIAAPEVAMEDVSVWTRSAAMSPDGATPDLDDAESIGFSPDEDGTFAVSRSEPWPAYFEVWATAPRARSRVVGVGEHETEAPIALRLEPRPYARVTVTDAAGVPLRCHEPGCIATHVAARLDVGPAAGPIPGNGNWPGVVSDDESDRAPGVAPDGTLIVPLDVPAGMTLVVGWHQSHEIVDEGTVALPPWRECGFDTDDLARRYGSVRVPWGGAQGPREVRLPSRSCVLEARWAGPDEADAWSLEVRGSWRTATERGVPALELDDSGEEPVIRLWCGDAVGPMEVDFTLAVPGWRPIRFGPTTLAGGERLPVTELRVTRE